MEFKKREVKAFKPSKKEMLNAMNEVSKFFSDDKVLGSKDHPELKVRGKQSKNINVMDYKILKSHQEFDNKGKLLELAVMWESNELGWVRATYCTTKPKAGYEHILPTDVISPNLMQKVAGYGMNLPEEKREMYFSGDYSWER